MDSDHILSQFSIPTPCSMDWESMPGDERRRFCEACGKHVHDLTAMAAAELVQIGSKAFDGEDELCGRIAIKADGMLFGSESQPVVQSAGARQFTIRWLMTVIAACATALGITRLWMPSPEDNIPNPPVTNRSMILMGKMVPRSSPASPSSTSAPSCPPSASPAPGANG